MSSCSRRRLAAAAGFLLALATAPQAVRALNVHAVYRTACSREVGVILRVEKRDIRLLRLDGTVAKIPRHEIVSLLYYPLGQLPLTQVPTPTSLPPLRVTTRFQGRVVDLVTGWPIDYSDRQVSFLLRSGKELVVDRESIWSLSYESEVKPATVRTALRAAEAVDFVHPQTSGFCAPTRLPASQSSIRPIFAHQVLNDQIVIRRELDRLFEGYEQIVEYEQDQKFYPVPYLYTDRTMLGLWVSGGSRYGASSTRTNNYTPLLVDELALGPFRYQHIFLTGAAPNDMFLHHEAQSQIFYRFKAAYFHASVFLDPNLLLVGTRYNWREADFEDESLDDRISETFAIEFGFDWGPLAIELYPGVAGQSAVKIGDFFDAQEELNLWRAGARLTFPAFRIQLAAGRASSDGLLFLDSSWEYSYGRLNVGFQPIGRLDVAISTLARTLTYQARAGGAFLSYDSLCVSNSVQASYALSHRLSVGGHIILEYQRRDSSSLDERSRLLPRGGVFTGFWF